MNLLQICISNYRSIKELTIDIQPIDGSNTFTLLGINESGKSSILKAIHLFDTEGITYPQDYYNDSESVKVELKYELTSEEKQSLYTTLKEVYKVKSKILEELKLEKIDFKVEFGTESPNKSTLSRELKLDKKIFPLFTFNRELNIVEERTSEDQVEFDAESLINEFFPDFFWSLVHKISFWRTSPEYLINQGINLIEFTESPKSVSIPLFNCFELANIKDITKEIAKLNDSGSIHNLETKLSDIVSEHINKLWPEHPIKIKFKINNHNLSFLVEDNDVKYSVKTTSQRSDGFRQIVSFLLTAAAENKTGELRNTILLLDEPETHLHPTAQINLKDELIKITQNDNNNIVFFATHSNYMIDKSNIQRCYKVIKKDNKETNLEQIKNVNCSYSEVNFEVFGIVTTDYHNELYGFIEDIDKSKLDKLTKDRKWHNEKSRKDEDVSLSKYIRHSIHHPENTSNDKITEEEIKESIEILRSLKYGI